MLLEGVIVSANYSDYLCWTLPLNKYIFDRLIVVTADSDWHTQNLCRHYNVECVRTNIFDNGKFPKSIGINIGLNRLSRTGFLCHLDSDIVLPPRTKEMLEIAKLRDDTIYGILRMNCPDFPSWLKWFYKPHFIHEQEIFVHYDSFPVGAIVSKTYMKDLGFAAEPGYVPIGFTQIWSERNGKHLNYPNLDNDAGKDDMIFALHNFPKREHRQLIPEIVAVHLGTPDVAAGVGVNWRGRTTQIFGPESS